MASDIIERWKAFA